MFKPKLCNYIALVLVFKTEAADFQCMDFQFLARAVKGKKSDYEFSGTFELGFFMNKKKFKYLLSRLFYYSYLKHFIF